VERGVLSAIAARRALAAMVVAVLGVGTADAGCILFSNFDHLDDGVGAGGTATTTSSHASSGSGTGGTGGGGGSGASGGAGGACNAETTFPCSSLHRAPPGFTQKVDGKGDEFCDLSVFSFLPRGGQFRTCPPPSFIDQAKTTANVRTAWDNDGVHIFAHVDKLTNIEVAPLADNLQDYDSIEFYVANTGTPTGDVATDHGMQIVVGPANNAAHVRASGAIMGMPKFAGSYGTKSYDVEVSIAWGDLGGPVPTAGDHVLWDLRVNTRDGSGTTYKGFENYTKPNGQPLYCDFMVGDPDPATDDTTWCKSKLDN
jgi:hypothetical protein